MPPWSRSSSTFAMFLRLAHCSRRRPATHASRVRELALERFHLAHAAAREPKVDAAIHQVGALAVHQRGDLGRVGILELHRDPVPVAHLLEQRVGLGRQPAGVQREHADDGSMRHAMSISTMPSTPPAALIAIFGWKLFQRPGQQLRRPCACSNRSAASWTHAASSSSDRHRRLVPRCMRVGVGHQRLTLRRHRRGQRAARTGARTIRTATTRFPRRRDGCPARRRTGSRTARPAPTLIAALRGRPQVRRTARAHRRRAR